MSGAPGLYGMSSSVRSQEAAGLMWVTISSGSSTVSSDNHHPEARKTLHRYVPVPRAPEDMHRRTQGRQRWGGIGRMHDEAFGTASEEYSETGSHPRPHSTGLPPSSGSGIAPLVPAPRLLADVPPMVP